MVEAAGSRLKEEIANSSKEMKALADISSAFGQITESAFEDAILAGKSYREVLQGIANDLTKVILRQTITKPLGDAVSKLATSIGGSIAGSLFGGGSATINATPVLGGVYAEGGRPPLGRVSLVGEEGPELFIPDVAGTIPNGEWGGSGGGVTNNIMVDARHSRLSAAEIRAIITSAVSESKAAVADGARLGGSFAASFRR